jgi:UPF0755 protein
MPRLIGVAVILASFGLGWLWMDFQRFVEAPLPNQEVVIFEIDKGDSFDRIVARLSARNLIEKPLWFKLLGYSKRASTKIKFGEYEVPPGTTAPALLAKLVAGEVRQHALTFLEGWTFRQVMEELNRQPALSHRLLDKSSDEIMSLIGLPGEHPEGRFYPDTYFFTKGTSDIDMLQRAQRRMQSALDDEWRRRDPNLPLKTAYEALILASIVEKETGRADERRTIAGVFIRRLTRGMRLQTDPTVIYGLQERFTGDLKTEHLDASTPYNTYRNAGLPPTPIALPGIDSIRSVLHPDGGDSLYFVARGDGSHVFSATLEEHNRAVEIFQKGQHE